MSKSDTFESDLLRLIFNATAIANLADNAASAPVTNLYVSLHTADPTDAGTQASSEATFTNYARQPVARTTGGWTVSGSSPTQVTNVGAVTFPECGASGNTITHFGIGTSVSGAGKLLYKGALAASRAVSSGISLNFAAGTIVVSEE